MKLPRMRLLGACAAAAALMTPAPGAQETATVEAALHAARQQQRFLLSGSLELSPAESAKFWPAYDRYAAVIAALDARAARLIVDFLRSQPAPPAATAAEMVDEYMRVESERSASLTSHVADLRKVLPPAKLIRYLQLRNRLDLKVRWDLAQQMPLASP